MADYPHGGELSYAVADINGDCVNELLIGTKEELACASPNLIYTLMNGKPVLILEFWYRSKCCITIDGIIYDSTWDSAANQALISYQLEKNALDPTRLTYLHSEFSFLEDKPYYVQEVNSRNHYISEEEFYNLFELYENPPDRMKLTVYPIAG